MEENKKGYCPVCWTRLRVLGDEPLHCSCGWQEGDEEVDYEDEEESEEECSK